MDKFFNRSRRRRATLALVALFCLVLGWHAYRINQTNVQAGRDFKCVYAGSRCLVLGCDPYDSLRLKQVFLNAGGTYNDVWPFVLYNANYPPNALFLVLPVAMLPWNVASAVWTALIAISITAAALLITELCLPSIPAMVVPLLYFITTGMMLFRMEQPSGIAIALCVSGICLLLRQQRPRLAVVLFSLSLVLKPQIAGVVWIYLVMAPQYRRRGWQILGATALLSAPGILWASVMPASRHWMTELHANLAGIAAYGSLSDPSPANSQSVWLTNLQSVTSLYFPAPAWKLIALGFFVILFGAWVYCVQRNLRRGGLSREQDYIAVAAAACLTMLPVYHRSYDMFLLMMVFPALAVLLKIRDTVAVPLLAVFALTVYAGTEAVRNYAMVHLLNMPDGRHPLQKLLIGHPLPLLLALLVCLLLPPLYHLHGRPPASRASAL